MAVITALGYSFVDDAVDDLGFTAQIPFYVSDLNELNVYTFDLYRGNNRSHDTLDLGWSKELAGTILQIWQNPVFFQQYCLATGPTRPTTGQVYPRGYS
jgi:hypothetical protein